MNIQIQEISMTNIVDFYDLFKGDNFEDPSWGDCYCMYYLDDCSLDEFSRKSGDENKRNMTNRIKNGIQKGFLGYDGETCVGWVNAGPAYGFPRIKQDLPTKYLNDKTMLTICFILQKEYRGKKVASTMLDQIILYAKEHHYEKIIALPTSNKVYEQNYRGVAQMYLNRGYELVDEELNLYVRNL